ncbi:MAG: leucine-rich repeat domain-containing protein, partial [Treponema sp.]|nr:leucine-rich repeat domain-containing protein [Treponema sp.]
VIIAGSVKNIGEQAFYGIANNNNYTGPNMHGNRIASLTIANGVESIGNRAFHNNRLASIVIPGSVKRIGSQAFQYQWALLTSLTIENGVENIDTGAFRENGKLLSVTIPGSVKTIADYAFHAASGLRHVTLNEGLDSIGQYAFYGREIANITIPNSVTYIGDYAFQQTNLSTVHIGQGVLVNNGFPTGFRECYSSANDLAAGIYEKVNNNTWRKSE